MPDYTRNDVWRLKRTVTHLNKALDSLTRAGGELRPKQFDKLRKALSEVSNDTEALVTDIERVVQEKPQKSFDLDDDEKQAAE